MKLPQTAPLPMLAALAVGLAGCAPDYPWYREGMTEAQLKQDMEECYAQARSYGFLNPDRNGALEPGRTGRVVARDEGDLFRACMNARGYARVPPPKEAGAKPGGAD